jgi:hypothetical protein
MRGTVGGSTSPPEGDKIGLARLRRGFETTSNHYHFLLKYVKPSKIAENNKIDEFV